MRQIDLAIGEFYHLYNRGNSKQVIFKDRADYHHFMKLMFVSNSSHRFVFRNLADDSFWDKNMKDPYIAIGLYCLMPNHFHIAATPLVENGISLYMQRLCTAYSMYFNKKYERTGTLFEGRFKSRYVDSDEYLKYLYAYIHLNPVKLIDKDRKEQGSKDAAKSFDFAASFQYSSLQDYLGSNRPESLILDKQPFPEYFATSEETKSELFEWLTYQEFIINQTQPSQKIDSNLDRGVP